MTEPNQFAPPVGPPLSDIDVPAGKTFALLPLALKIYFRKFHLFFALFAIVLIPFRALAILTEYILGLDDLGISTATSTLFELMAHALLIPILAFTLHSILSRQERTPIIDGLAYGLLLAPRVLWVSAAYWIVTLLGAVLGLIPGLVFAILFFLAIEAVCVDGCSFVESFSRSRKIIKGRKFRVGMVIVFGLVVLLFLISMEIKLATVQMPRIGQEAISFGLDLIGGIFMSWHLLIYFSLRKTEGSQTSAEK